MKKNAHTHRIAFLHEKLADAHSSNKQTKIKVLKEIQVSRMTKHAQYWADLLFATGGKLNYDKCYWYLIRWKWDDNGQPQIMTKEELPASIQLLSGDKTTTTTIAQKNPSESL
mmetsp:Transcript_5116/g.7890  ORF Transcript_5116/g.7890 Transcript_5116/m.7890 type:complete len:113 (+) Transcript_5116:179-517(+)